MATMTLDAKGKQTSHIKTVTFAVSMSCENCKKTFERNIAFEKGMKDMKVDLENKRVTLTFDTRKNDEQKIIEAFNKLGYDAVVLEEKDKKS